MSKGVETPFVVSGENLSVGVSEDQTSSVDDRINLVKLSISRCPGLVCSMEDQTSPVNLFKSRFRMDKFVP
jgi:hypothetical protein